MHDCGHINYQKVVRLFKRHRNRPYLHKVSFSVTSRKLSCVSQSLDTVLVGLFGSAKQCEANHLAKTIT